MRRAYSNADRSASSSDRGDRSRSNSPGGPILNGKRVNYDEAVVHLSSMPPEELSNGGRGRLRKVAGYPETGKTL